MTMPTIETPLWPLEKPTPDVGVGVFLGGVALPALAGLSGGERVLLVEPNELQAGGTLRQLELGGRQVWFAEIGTLDAIRVIYPDTSEAPASAQHPARNSDRKVFDINPDINPGELWHSSVGHGGT